MNQPEPDPEPDHQRADLASCGDPARAAIQYDPAVRTVAAILLVSFGCTDDVDDLGPGDGGVVGVDAQPRDVGSADSGVRDLGVSCLPGRDHVQGVFLRHFVLADQVTTAAEDVSGRTIAAWAREQGVDVRYDGVGSADGSFFIECVPDGPFILEVRSGQEVRLTATNQRFITHEAWTRGRADAVVPTQQTELTVDVNNVAPSATGLLEVFGSAGHLAAVTTMGETRVDVPVILHQPQTLLSAARGDWLLVTQPVIEAAPFGNFTTLVRSAYVADVDTPDGSMTTRAVNAVEPDKIPVRIELQRAQFANALRPQPERYQIRILSVPSGAPTLVDPPPGELQLWSALFSDAPTDLSIDIEVPRPLPNEKVVVALEAEFIVSGSAFYNYIVRKVLDDEATITLAPELGAVGSLQVEGRPASGSVRDVGVTPTFGWTAPQLGTAEHYRGGLIPRGPGPYIAFVTEGTEFRIPPGVLTQGQNYHGVVRAWGEGEDLTAPRSVAGIVSITP